MSDQARPPLMTLQQVAEALNVSTQSVRLYIRQGRIPRIAGMGAIRIRPEDLDAFTSNTGTTHEKA